MWLNYQKERFGYSSIEKEYGFLLYWINHPFVRLEEIYVKPELRVLRNGTEMLNELCQIGRENKCTHVWSQVWLNDRNHQATLKAAWASGFKSAGAQNDRIILLKAIEEV